MRTGKRKRRWKMGEGARGAGERERKVGEEMDKGAEKRGE